MAFSGTELDSALIITYRVVNLVNGKRYIGVTKCGVKSRRWKHLSSARRGRAGRLNSAIRKYGEENFRFSVLECFETYENALQGEIELIAAEKPEYNVSLGGSGVHLASVSDETRRKLSAAAKGRQTFLGKKHRPESIEKMRLASTGAVGFWRGKKRAPETVEKIRAAHLANPTRYWLGKKRSVESTERMRVAKTGVPRKPAPPHALAIFAENMRRAARARRRPVVCLNDNAMFDSIMSAADHYGLKKFSVGAVCRKSRTSVHGFRFAFAREISP